MSAHTPARTATRGPLGPLGRLNAADLSASVTVFLIALPLSLGIALTAGAPLQAGLVAAAVGGIVGGRLGGSPLQIGGPAAGLTIVTADLIHVYGWRATCALTIVAGLAQLALGFLRVARSALAVSPAIVHGMLAGIGVTIALAQVHIVLGGDPEESAIDNALTLPGRLADPHPAALTVSAVTVAVLLGWPWLRRRWGPDGAAGAVTRWVPAALAAVTLATAVASLSGMRLPRVHLPSWRSHALPEQPEGPVLGMIAAVLTVALVASVQSLLSAVAVDKMAAKRTGSQRVPPTDFDRELRGLGVSNMVSGALGGLPVAGVAVRSAANAAAGAVSRNSAILHGVWVLLAAGLLVGVLELIPLAALAALVMVVGVQMVSITHIRTVTRHRESLVHAATTAGVVLLGVLQGIAVGGAVAVALALHRLARTRISSEVTDGVHRVRVRGQLTFLAVPRLSRTLGQVPEGADAVVELDGSFMDHAAYETLQEWCTAHASRGGSAKLTGRYGQRIAEPATGHSCSPWTPWRNHQCTRPPVEHAEHTPRRGQLLGGVRNFQRTTAPLVRDELARLAREGQRPSQLFLTCADSRLITSMITSSGPGDLFTVRNVGNFVPLPGDDSADDSVAAAIEYAVDVLQVESITVCGHSGCGAMAALHAAGAAAGARAAPAVPGGPGTPLGRWLRHGAPSVRRLAAQGGSAPRLATREPEGTELLCLTNVVQQLEHLTAHECVARRLAEGGLELHGMYFHVGEAQAYVLDHPYVLDRPYVPDHPDASGRTGGAGARTVQPAVFTPVRPEGALSGLRALRVPRTGRAERPDRTAWECP
ncbi:transporter [Streptomyces armeniacus]|uniref:Transporter n=1 Tax=Streptomyces armeniacus TaxID=83291 RepID=A0A345XPR6_9ACTN|nr:SulP family inorganic anion transporter [Streptomyces armeniacus]AXK33632.1 transporter [Streptomyces armeniacus]